jgi:hypothetical protein
MLRTAGLVMQGLSYRESAHTTAPRRPAFRPRYLREEETTWDILRRSLWPVPFTGIAGRRAFPGLARAAMNLPGILRTPTWCRSPCTHLSIFRPRTTVYPSLVLPPSAQTRQGAWCHARPRNPQRGIEQWPAYDFWCVWSCDSSSP